MCSFIDAGRKAIAKDTRKMPDSLCIDASVLEHYTLPPPTLGTIQKLLPVGSECYAKIITKYARPIIVDLFSDSNCQHHVRPVEALPPRLDCSMVGESIADISRLATMKTCYVSHFNTTQDFWLQVDCEQIDTIFTELENAKSFEILQNVEIGDICAAHWDSDDTYYRARVVRPEDGGESNQVFVLLIISIHFQYFSLNVF